MLKKIYYITRDFTYRLNRKNINAYAASTAFFLFVSLIPMLILLCTIIPYTPLTQGNLMKAITEFTPTAVHPMIVSIISDVYDKSVGILSTAAIMTLWSAGKGMLALMRGLNVINGVEERRSGIVLRLIASVYTLIMLAVLLLSLLIMVFGNVLVNLIINQLPSLGSIFSFLLNFRSVILWAVFSIGLALIYAYIPGTRTKLWMQLPGAALSAWAWSLGSFGFSIYVDEFNGFNAYGSLTTIVMIMIWLYIGIYVIMLGAYMNKYFRPLYIYMHERRKSKRELEQNENN
ncbi:MAG: YihY/virulence factor BrkB family protein [Lachnospiraceae bacterium]|jgi:membrane protein|nr:YihY/virulence factor BrkB family protein [Lachnospiraceae bacterium]